MEIAILSIIDKIYPVGSYYETSDPEFNPDEAWGGTWSRDTNGYVTVGCQDPDESGITFEDNDRLLINVGATEGEVKHTLTVNEIPSHNHTPSSLGENWVYNTTEMARIQVQQYNSGNWRVPSSESGLDAWKWGTTGNTGGSQAHNNIQPSIGVYRWHRIA